MATVDAVQTRESAPDIRASAPMRQPACARNCPQTSSDNAVRGNNSGYFLRVTFTMKLPSTGM